MKTAILQRARHLGFDDCRFTHANVPDSSKQFVEWLDQKRHGEMAWIERNSQKRIDPALVLQNAKSIITLAVSYDLAAGSLMKKDMSLVTSTATRGEDCGPLGVVARYARFKDYHDVIAAKLRELTDFVDSVGATDSRSLWYVDTGPLLERDLAQRAGVGFVGKHTNLISRKLGNWFFLAEIITTLKLEPDTPEKNRCGTCTRCITACPTQAITAPFQLDARRCISYLTIELKGSIPVEFRRAIGDRIYGCDDCLAACPWNRFAHEGGLMKQHQRNDLQKPDLHSLLALDDAGFKKMFNGTPMLRTKRRGLLRNVCVALGNVGNVNSLPHLEKAKNDPEPLIAEHADWAIREIKGRKNSATDLHR